MDHGHITSLYLETSRGLKSQEATSNDHRLFAGSRVIEQRARVVEIAEDEHTFLIHAFDRRNQG